MGTIIGTDEAGYGPNYGPLIVAATSWEVDDLQTDLREALADAVCQFPTSAADARIEIADSKALYGSNQSLGRLERGVIGFFLQLFDWPNNCSELIRSLDPRLKLTGTDSRLFEVSGHPVISSCSRNALQEDASALNRCLAQAGIRFSSMQVRCIFPSNFNELLDQHGNKANVLSNATLGLIRELMPREGDVRIVCDKHGGRSKYAALIQHYLTNDLVHVRHESMQISKYTWRSENREAAAEFLAKGEVLLPIALASMTAKYIRERFMEAWNVFWTSLIPGLKPTAGYPSDAKRFRSAIAKTQQQLEIAEQLVWRMR